MEEVKERNIQMSKYDRSLAQFLSEKKIHQPIGHGAARKAFYSPMHNVVFKVIKDNNWRDQQGKEIQLFNKLTKAEKKNLPIREVITFRGQPIIVMDLVSMTRTVEFYTYYGHSISSIFKSIKDYGERRGVNVSNALSAAQMIHKYAMCDLNERNVGILGDRFVIVDAGIAHADF